MSNYDEVRELTRQGIAAFKARNKAQAAALFQQAIQLDPDNQAALLWLAGCTSDLAERQQYLTRVVRINPNNESGIKAASALAEMQTQQQNAPAPAPPPAQQQNAPAPAPATATPNTVQASAAALASAKALSHPLDNQAGQQNADVASLTAPPQQAGVQPFVPPAKGQRDAALKPFVLGPQNRAFAEGRARYPAGRHNYRLGLLLFGIFFAFGIGLLIAAVNTWQAGDALDERGVDTQGEVISRRIYESDADESYYLTYRFAASGEDGQTRTYTAEDEVNYGTYQRLTPGSRAGVRYVPDDPTISRIEGFSTTDNTMLTIMALLWNAFTIPVFILILIMSLVDWRQMREGQVLVGTLEQASGYDDGDGGYMVTVEYEFLAPGEGWIHKTSKEVLRNDLQKKPLPERGTPVLVWYKDRENFVIL